MKIIQEKSYQQRGTMIQNLQLQQPSPSSQQPKMEKCKKTEMLTSASIFENNKNQEAQSRQEDQVISTSFVIIWQRTNTMLISLPSNVIQVPAIESSQQPPTSDISLQYSSLDSNLRQFIVRSDIERLYKDLKTMDYKKIHHQG